MSPKIAITGASGKIGGAVLTALLDYKLVAPSDLVIATSSRDTDSVFQRALSLGATIRRSNYGSVDLMTEAFQGCEKLFLVSTPHIHLDFYGREQGGRESHHFNALEAAKRAGVSHVYYTSLAFGAPSQAAVMRAHLVTEDFLRMQKSFDFTILREGLYNESWPLYLGHFQVPDDRRDTVVIGPDGPISWTAIEDLGLASALILMGDRQAWAGKTLYLSAKKTLTMVDVAILVGVVRRRRLWVESHQNLQEYIDHYTKQGMDRGMIEWWSSTYPALQAYECKIQDSLLEDLLASRGREPKTMEQSIVDMFSAARA